jgi:hypothetical protein
MQNSGALAGPLDPPPPHPPIASATITTATEHPFSLFIVTSIGERSVAMPRPWVKRGP